MEKTKQDAEKVDEKKRRKESKRGRKVLRVLLWLACLGILAYAGLVSWVYYAETHVPEPSDYDSIIVLGAQVLPNRRASVQLRWRLDKAQEMYEKNPCPIVVSGAQGPNEPAPEGQVMREILIADGIPEGDVFAEIAAGDTKENIRNAWAILSELGAERPLVVTSDYHLPRALAIARDVGLHPQGAGSLCRNEPRFWLQNHLREALAWGKYWGIKYLGLPL